MRAAGEGRGAGTFARSGTFAVLAVAALLAAGCGYTFGSGLHEQGVRTVALRVAGNDTMRQRLEADISLALSRELYASSDLRPVASDPALPTLSHTTRKLPASPAATTGSCVSPVV